MDLLTYAEIDELLALLGDEDCGENCEYDDLYLQLDELALGTPASQMGDSYIDGKEPDYRTLYKNCVELFKKTHDLRVASFFTLVLLHGEGLEGLKKGLKIINYLVSTKFDSFYPQLDPDDDNDPTERINILSMLSPENGAYSDQYNFLSQLRSIKLINELPYSYRDYLVSSGFLESANNELDVSVLNSQMSAIPLVSIQERLTLVNDIFALIDSTISIFNERVGDLGYLSMETLKHELSVLRNFYNSFVKNSIVQDENVSDKDIEAENDKKLEKNGTSANLSGQRIKEQNAFDLNSFEPRNRNEALLLLKKSADYFLKTEPTNPVPYLLNRALRMANMNFIDLLAEIDQNALDRAREQLGVLQNNNDEY